MKIIYKNIYTNIYYLLIFNYKLYIKIIFTQLLLQAINRKENSLFCRKKRQRHYLHQIYLFVKY